MNKFNIIIKLTILASLVISSFIVLYYFFYYNQVYESDSSEIEVNRMITIFCFILIFYIPFFLMNNKCYNLFFLFIIINDKIPITNPKNEYDNINSNIILFRQILFSMILAVQSHSYQHCELPCNIFSVILL